MIDKNVMATLFTEKERKSNLQNLLKNDPCSSNSHVGAILTIARYPSLRRNFKLFF
jgi:hypothetical protein